MSIFFDFKTIKELIGDNCYIQPQEFTLKDSSQYNGTTRMVDTFTNAPINGGIIDEDYISDIDNVNFISTLPTNRQIKQDTSKFTPDDWIRYITPLVTYALRDTTLGMNSQRAYEKFILLGVLVGLGKTPEEAINQVQDWQKTGASQLLKSGTSTGGTGTSSGIGSGGTGSNGSTALPPNSTTFIPGNGMGMQGSGNMPTNRQINQNKSNFTPDDWIRYINPLVTYALRDSTLGMNTQRAYEKFILLGVLVGLGKTPEEAINQVQDWQKTGASQLLKSGTSTGGTATSGSPNSVGTGTSGGFGSGGSGTSGGTNSGGTGTSGGFGSGGSGTSGGPGSGGTGTSGNTNISNRLYFD